MYDSFQIDEYEKYNKMVNKIDDEYECPFDILMLKFIDSHLDLYYKLKLTPNMITTIGIMIIMIGIMIL